MSKVEEAQEILKALGLPKEQNNEMSALTLLALCGIKEGDKWSKTQQFSLGVSKGIMKFVSENYAKNYAPNSRETFRRHVLHQFVQARIVDYNPEDSSLPVNSPNAHYALSSEVLPVIKSFKTKNWKKELNNFLSTVGELKVIYERNREYDLIPVLVNGIALKLSPGKHNELQVSVLNEFAPRFIKNAKLLYMGDTANKDLYILKEELKRLGVLLTEHNKIPDIVIVDEEKGWLFLIEVVTSHGPISPKRLIELEKLFKPCQLGKIYVTVFPNRTEFKRHIAEIAWETEVWIADAPDHLIHFNGDKFIGPHKV
ncbi:BsuBI/PstI family type II restriction endonuclease [Ignavibacteriales bacterium]